MSFETCSNYVKTRLATDKSAERLTQAAKPCLNAGQTISVLKKSKNRETSITHSLLW
jgi:hypothetical protein